MAEKKENRYVTLLLTLVLSMAVGAVFMMIVGYHPLEAYIQLFKGAFVGKVNLGTTLQKFVPILLTGVGFSIAAKVGCFNAGIEGELYLGAIAAAWAGHYLHGIPAPLHLVICFMTAAAAGALWAAIPAILKVRWKVNEICVCILATYVAKYLTSWLCNGPMSAKTGIPQTLSVSEGVMLAKIMRPSQANTGLFVALLLVAGAIWLIYRSTLGYKFTTVGLNIHHAEYMGINARRTVIQGMMLSGAFGGIAGAIESLGVYGYFLDNFSLNIANDGMLSSMIVWNDICLVPIMSFFVAALKAGALSMERFAGVPRSIVDTITAVFIIFATMETLFTFHKKKKAVKSGAGDQKNADKGGERK
ncbi:ABC transporter permease [Enterocloster sp. OA13]|uniref:ABC transporter permease n=1 Tax=Enterocloster sp. OA13 TaxID=2914161 RepID=UPI000472C7E8|nr:ABC transporter permease [Clostridiales bacterium]MCH1947590.1 ABC transporter permease [Enterocloster sp. OA13]